MRVEVVECYVTVALGRRRGTRAPPSSAPTSSSWARPRPGGRPARRSTNAAWVVVPGAHDGRCGRGRPRTRASSPGDPGSGPGGSQRCRRAGAVTKAVPGRPNRLSQSVPRPSVPVGSAAPRRCAASWPRPGSHPADLVAPLFVPEGRDEPRPIASLPGAVQHTRASLREEVRGGRRCGVGGVILFGVPAAKDAVGSGRCRTRRRSCRSRSRACATTSATSSCSMADLCLDEYTDHGHCGVLDAHGDVSTTTPPSSCYARGRARPGRGRRRHRGARAG